MSTIAGISGTQLRQFIERIEYLEEQKSAIAGDIRDVMSEAKGVGFEPKIIREILKLRKMNGDERQEQESLLEVYLNALSQAETSSAA
jgi:uncharacterized protein (UPF0335 family)